MEFWRRYAKCQGDHPIFSQGGVNFARTIPILSHGDEGRGKKKRAVMIWSMKGIAGSGTEVFRERPKSEQSIRMPLNLDNSMRSRFLHAAVPNRFYRDNQACWFDLAEKIGKSYNKLQHVGFTYDGYLWRACCVGVTGDAPFLSKVACLSSRRSPVCIAAMLMSRSLPRPNPTKTQLAYVFPVSLARGSIRLKSLESIPGGWRPTGHHQIRGCPSRVFWQPWETCVQRYCSTPLSLQHSEFLRSVCGFVCVVWCCQLALKHL